MSATVYPVLVSRGCELPLSVVVDLVALYSGGADAWLLPPKQAPVAAALMHGYCDLVNRLAALGPLRRMIQESHRRSLVRARSKSTGRPLVRPGEADLPGVLVFLEGARSLFGAAAQTFLHDVERRFWLEATGLDAAELQQELDAEQANDPEDPFAVGHMERFLTALHITRPHPPRDTAVHLVAAAARTPDGARALDLRLLHACLGYRLLVLPPQLSSRYQVLRRATVPRRDERQRASEPMMEDVRYGRCAIRDALPSWQARHEFPDLWAIGHVLSYRRYTQRVEPHRVLLGWVVERGTAMQERGPDGVSLASSVLEVVAQQIEDSVRYFRDLPGIDLRIAVLLHDEKSNARYLEPSPHDLAHAPGVNETASPWITDVAAMLPHFLLREPVWPGDPEDPEDARNDAGRRSRNPLRGPIGARLPADLMPCEKGMVALAALAARSLTADAGDPFHLLYVTLAGRAESLPDAERRDRSLRALRQPATAALATLACTAAGQSWTSWRPATGELEVTCQRAHGASAESVRLAYWNDLESRLRRL